MNIIHKNYNLNFVNQIWEGKVHKTCEIINENVVPNYSGLSTYLIYIQYPADIPENLLPEVENALNGEDIDISIDTITVSVGQIETKIDWNAWGGEETLLSVDFKKILIEYYNFLISTPLEGTKIK